MFKKLIEKLFGKFCKCKMEEIIIKKPISCMTHSRFMKSCVNCIRVIKTGVY
jgi:hypothetical protein|tara:strand:+ start:65 stop:220 length:156 start_codon:yes stop_codon:yes gene_type:complete